MNFVICGSFELSLPVVDTHGSFHLKVGDCSSLSLSLLFRAGLFQLCFRVERKNKINPAFTSPLPPFLNEVCVCVRTLFSLVCVYVGVR